MNPATASSTYGNWATLLLPINSDDSIDFGLLSTELDIFAEARVNGVYSNGSAGEFYAQSEDEFDRVSSLLADRCERAKISFQIGACHASPQISLERVRRAKALRPSAFQVVLPDWFSPVFDEIVMFLERMLEVAAPVPLILYNPPHAKRRLTPPEWAQLVDRFPGVIGMKVPGGDEDWYSAMLPVMRKASVFIPGHTLASGLSYGAHGAYSNVACLQPVAAQRWYDLCRANPDAGLAQEKRIQSFWSAHVAPLITQHKLPNMAADKAAAVAGGWLPGFSSRLRWPYRCATPEMCAEIARNARAMLPEFFN